MVGDQLKQWHRLINPVLFAYREVPQESTGFSPFSCYTDGHAGDLERS